MNRIDLTGLRPDVPIGVMAALGCLRLTERIAELRGACLSWDAGHAVLWTPADLTPDGLVDLLIGDVRRAAVQYQWPEQIKSLTPGEFREQAEAAIASGDREAADWYAAFGSDQCTEEKVDTTPLDMSVARQKFPGDAVKLAQSLAVKETLRNRKSAAESYREALFGPWRYEDDQHSFGWDPATVKLGAFTWKAPTALVNAGVRAAVWLAFESLPVFPTSWRNRLRTRCFVREGRRLFLYWPVWSPRCTLRTVESLLADGGILGADAAREELEARGVTAVYRSQRFKPNKYMTSFRSAELVFSARAGR